LFGILYRGSNFGKIRARRMMFLHLGDAFCRQRRIRPRRTMTAVAANAEPNSRKIMSVVLAIEGFRLDVFRRLVIDGVQHHSLSHRGNGCNEAENQQKSGKTDKAIAHCGSPSRDRSM